MTTATNITSPIGSNSQISAEYIILCIGYVLLFIVGIVGNGFVIFKTEFLPGTLKKSFHIQIISLAIADLLASILIPVTTIYDLITNYAGWDLFGIAACKLFGSVMPALTMTSAWMMVSITVARFRYEVFFC